MLESAILLDHGDEDAYDDLIEVLALYSPRGGRHHTHADEVRAAIVAVLAIGEPGG